MYDHHFLLTRVPRLLVAPHGIFNLIICIKIWATSSHPLLKSVGFVFNFRREFQVPTPITSGCACGYTLKKERGVMKEEL